MHEKLGRKLGTGMGCTPSIHVNQTGVVFCRESEESNSYINSFSSSYPTRVLRAAEAGEPSNLKELSFHTIEESGLKSVGESPKLKDSDLYAGKESFSVRESTLLSKKTEKDISNIEAETQTSRIDMKVGFNKHVFLFVKHQAPVIVIKITRVRKSTDDAK